MFIPKTTLPRFLFHCSTVLRLGGYLTGVHPLKIPPRGVEHNFTNNDSNITYNPDRVKRWPESGTDSVKTPKIRPDYADSHYNLGNAYGKLGRHQEAIDAFKQAVRIKPDDAEAHCNLGFAYLEMGDKNSALAEYNILKSLNSQLANNLLNQINQ